MLHALDTDEDVVHVSLIARSWPAASQAVGEFLAAASHRFIGNGGTAFSQDQLDIASRRLVRILCVAVEAFVLAVLDAGHDLAFGRSIIVPPLVSASTGTSRHSAIVIWIAERGGPRLRRRHPPALNQLKHRRVSADVRLEQPVATFGSSPTNRRGHHHDRPEFRYAVARRLAALPSVAGCGGHVQRLAQRADARVAAALDAGDGPGAGQP
jgi:hypothetical protein